MTFPFECTKNRDRNYWKTGHRSRMSYTMRNGKLAIPADMENDE